MSWQLPELVTALDAQAGWADRNTWLVRLIEWIDRPGDVAKARPGSTALPRLRHLLNVLERHAELERAAGELLRRLWFEGDAAALFAEAGFAPRPGMLGAMAHHLRQRWTPTGADTRDLGALFHMALRGRRSLDWLREIDEPTLDRLAVLCLDSAADPRDWRGPLIQAMQWLGATLQAWALRPDVRRRIAAPLQARHPFEHLQRALGQLAMQMQDDAGAQAALPQAANYLRGAIAACRQAAASVREHLRQNGLSMGLLIDERQMQGRLDRIEALLDVVVAPEPARRFTVLLASLAEAPHAGDGRPGLPGLLSDGPQLLARRLAQRHADVGEHYLARDGEAGRLLLRRAAGGGFVVAFTTWAKFAIVALAWLPLWTGLASGLAYAASFVLIHLMHATLATKQPAMTAAALAARLERLQASHGRGSLRAAIGCVDQVRGLLRSQLLGVIGNLGLVVPTMAALQGLAWWLAGRPLIDASAAQHVLEGLHLMGPSALFAAFTGVLLYASSVAGGWAENLFVFHQLHAVLATHPRLVARLGAARAGRWACWWRTHVHGLASNTALGLMLGLLPPLLGFVGLPLDVRHVTLSGGQLTAAVGTLGWPVLATPAFWGCVAGVAAIGLLNLSVSFALALRSALRARRLSLGDWRLLGAVLARRLGASRPRSPAKCG